MPRGGLLKVSRTAFCLMTYKLDNVSEPNYLQFDDVMSWCMVT